MNLSSTPEDHKIAKEVTLETAKTFLINNRPQNKTTIVLKIFFSMFHIAEKPLEALFVLAKHFAPAKNQRRFLRCEKCFRSFLWKHNKLGTAQVDDPLKVFKNQVFKHAKRYYSENLSN